MKYFFRERVSVQRHLPYGFPLLRYGIFLSYVSHAMRYPVHLTMNRAPLYPTLAEPSGRENLQSESSKGKSSDGAEGGTDLASGIGVRWWLNWGSGVSGWLWSLWGLGG